MIDGAAGSSLALVAQVARILNSGLSADETLRVVAATIRKTLAADSVVVWRREANQSTFAGVSVPTGEYAAMSLDELPTAARTVRRLALVHGGARMGVLEIDPGATGSVDQTLLQILCDLVCSLVVGFWI
jgi:GAF domain-containing protein